MRYSVSFNYRTVNRRTVPQIIVRRRPKVLSRLFQYFLEGAKRHVSWHNGTGWGHILFRRDGRCVGETLNVAAIPGSSFAVSATARSLNILRNLTRGRAVSQNLVTCRLGLRWHSQMLCPTVTGLYSYSISPRRRIQYPDRRFG